MVLAIETATVVCGAALVQDGAVVGIRELEQPHVHAERLPGLIGSLLQEAGIGPSGLEGVAVSAGPGSFTGLRIGLSTAKGLVYATGVPLVGVPTLEALAMRLVRVGEPGEGWILAALDARRDEVYAQIFRVGGGRLEAADDVRDLTMAALPVYVAQRPIVVTGDGAAKAGQALKTAGCTFTLAPANLRQCTAAELGLLGERMLREGVRSDPGKLEPRYIKEFFLKAR
jgi:tRNA threonylcarbamoyladenosine biosynthesis protein TsaB